MSTAHESPLSLPGRGQGEGSLHPRNRSLVGIAKRLRTRLTDVEKKLWYRLRNRQFYGFKFRRQYPIGGYVVDFICTEAKLIIELDGGQHALQSSRDHARDTWLHGEGYRVLRFWNNELVENLEGVLISIQSALGNPHPYPLPERERGQEEVS